MKVIPEIGIAFICFEERDAAKFAKEKVPLLLFKG